MAYRKELDRLNRTVSVALRRTSVQGMNRQGVFLLYVEMIKNSTRVIPDKAHRTLGLPQLYLYASRLNLNPVDFINIGRIVFYIISDHSAPVPGFYINTLNNILHAIPGVKGMGFNRAILDERARMASNIMREPRGPKNLEDVKRVSSVAIKFILDPGLIRNSPFAISEAPQTLSHSPSELYMSFIRDLAVLDIDRIRYRTQELSGLQGQRVRINGKIETYLATLIASSIPGGPGMYAPDVVNETLRVASIMATYDGRNFLLPEDCIIGLVMALKSLNLEPSGVGKSIIHVPMPWL